MIDNPPIPFHAIITGTVVSAGLSPIEAREALRDTLELSLDELTGSGGITGSHDMEVEEFSSSVNAGPLALLELVRHVQDLAQRAGYVVAVITPEQLQEVDAEQRQLANLFDSVGRDALTGLKDRKEGKPAPRSVPQVLRDSLFDKKLVPPEIHSIPVISTGHLTQNVADMFTQQGDNNPWCACAVFQYGFFIFLDALEEGETEPPKCLVDIRNWLRSLEQAEVIDNSRWLRLDSDGKKIEGLTFYEW